MEKKHLEAKNSASCSHKDAPWRGKREWHCTAVR
jgi:hypothetical protein